MAAARPLLDSAEPKVREATLLTTTCHLLATHLSRTAAPKVREALLAWQYAGRDCGARWLAFATPNPAALAALARAAQAPGGGREGGGAEGGLVELGAARGYWVRLLWRRGGWARRRVHEPATIGLWRWRMVLAVHCEGGSGRAHRGGASTVLDDLKDLRRRYDGGHWLGSCALVRRSS